jgi:hypothetical protein
MSPDDFGCRLDNQNWIPSEAMDISLQHPTETRYWLPLLPRPKNYLEGLLQEHE